MFNFDQASANTDAKAIAVGTMLVSLLPALIESKVITKDRALGVFDAALAGLLPRENMGTVKAAIPLIRQWRADLADKDI